MVDPATSPIFYIILGMEVDFFFWTKLYFTNGRSTNQLCSVSIRTVGIGVCHTAASIKFQYLFIMCHLCEVYDINSIHVRCEAYSVSEGSTYIT